MKKILFSILAATVSLLSANAQMPTPVIKPFAVHMASINKRVGDTNHALLTQEHGTVALPPSYYEHDGTSAGILIVHTEYGSYVAYDRKCPHCYENNQKGIFTMWSLMSAICNKCQSRAESIMNNGSGQLTGYDSGIKGFAYLTKYHTEVVERDGEKYLMIYPTNYKIPGYYDI